MSQSDQIDQLATALAAAQAVMSHATKNLTNPHFQNRYADLAAIVEAVREPLAKNGLSFTQTMGNRYLPDGNGNGMVFFALVTTLLHKSGQWISSDYPLPSGAKPQELGSALTYARRYSLSSICGIASEEDDDAEAASKRDDGVVGKALAAVAARKVQSRPGIITDEKGPLDD